ncbi:MAG TPA: WD40 repeat domain-containing protein, partial [Gemmataceae bacterium]|nr:WD40 repeat domain-containing protein [Gemmataceae bacterium]
LVVGGGAIRVWDLKQGKVVRQIPHAPRHLALFPDGKAVATSDGASMRVWDLTTGRDRHALGGPENALKAVAWSPDNRTVATWSWNGDVFLWDVVTGKTLYRFDVPAHRNVAFSPDGKLLAGATGGRLCVWDTATGKEVGPFKAHPSQPHHVAFTPDGKALVTMDFDDESVRRWDLATGQERLLFHLTPPDKKVRRHRFTTMAFSPEARLMALAEDRLDRTTALFGECDVYVYDVTTGKQLHRLKKHKNQLWALAFAPDGRVLVTAGRRFGGEGIILWDTATGKVIGSLPDGVDYGLAFSRDGRSFAAATRGTPICVWETATLRERCRFGGHPREGIYALAFAPDGRALISAGGDTTALVWDLTGLRRGQRLPALRLTPGEVEALWNDLQGDDAARAWRAIWKLAAAPADSLPALRKHLRPVPLPDAGKLARWIEELGSAKFAVRQRASQEFEKLGEVATPALRKALAGQVPEETRRRIEQLLARVENPAGGPGVLRMLRALEAVEHGGTDEARQFLRALAEGAPGARLTREARAALERLRP